MFREVSLDDLWPDDSVGNERHFIWIAKQEFNEGDYWN